jgi:regulator of sirC expression with transglutaminase-like and TPR domain
MRAGQSAGEVVIDPFTGHSLSRDELDQMLEPYKRSRGLPDEFDAPLSLFLQAATEREIVARMLRNLKEIHRSTRDWPRLLHVLQRLVVLLPQSWDERRDRGLAYAELGMDAAATRDLVAYLDHVSDAPDRPMIAERLGAIGRKGPAPLR